MMNQNVVDIECLDRELHGRLIHVRRLGVVVRSLTIVVYSAVLLWIAGCMYTAFWGWRSGLEPSYDTWIRVAVIFVAFLLLHFLLMYSLSALKNKEILIMRKALHHLFPGATYSANSTIPRTLLNNSALFQLLDADEDSAVSTGYGSIVFREDEGSPAIYDIGVSSGRVSGFLSRLPVVGFPILLYRSVVRPIFGAPIESSRHSFRGMFGTQTAPLNCQGNVFLLPDRLEEKIGYLAHSIQSFRSKNGARHMVLEDVEFEHLFAVYADDEIEARKILTPAMMRHITEVRRSFGKDILISFSGNRIYYAVPYPDGFLKPTRKSLNDGKLFEQIFREIQLGRKLLSF
ncbi:MAG: DUF3137 domain-containing protein [Coprobacter sp.]|nr:DUF3137 domain-containing protein [Coprobacter sp.]